MDAKTPEFLIIGPAATTATGVLLRVPLVEALTIVEFGFYVANGADLAAGVLKLQGIDTTANGATYTDFLTLTSTGAMDQGGIGARRCNVRVEKDATVLNATARTNRAIVNGTQTLPSAEKQFIAVQLNATTAFTMSSVIVPYLKIQKCGTGDDAITGETLVTS